MMRTITAKPPLWILKKKIKIKIWSVLQGLKKIKMTEHLKWKSQNFRKVKMYEMHSTFLSIFFFKFEHLLCFFIYDV